MFIDEIYQLIQGYLEYFHYAQIKYKVKLVCAGAGDQIPAPSSDNIYNFMTNDYFNNYMFDVRLELDYRKIFLVVRMDWYMNHWYTYAVQGKYRSDSKVEKQIKTIGSI